MDRAKPRVMGLVDYFVPFENEFGLLEKLDSWVFVEWSRANDPDVVQDVNFPTNMLYKRMLEAVASLYGEERLRKKAARIRQVIRERSFNGTFYTDNERRTESGLENPGNCTEVCQYYAFFTGTATKEEDAALWETLLRDFGFGRKELGLHPRVAFANAFIGNYLRIELLYREGLYEEVLDNIRGYFAKMVALTGTLWVTMASPPMSSTGWQAFTEPGNHPTDKYRSKNKQSRNNHALQGHGSGETELE